MSKKFLTELFLTGLLDYYLSKVLFYLDRREVHTKLTVPYHSPFLGLDRQLVQIYCLSTGHNNDDSKTLDSEGRAQTPHVVTSRVDYVDMTTISMHVNPPGI